MDITKEVPYSPEAEQAVLGSVFLDPGKITEITGTIKSEDFYIEKNKYIYAAMVELFNTGIPIDIVTVGNFLIKNNVFEAVGGSDYLKELLSNIPIAANVVAYAEIIRAKSIQRSLIKASEKISAYGYGPDSVDAMIDKSMDEIFQIATRNETGDVTPIKTILFENFGQLCETQKNGNNITGLPTGYKYLDKKILGMQPGNLILIAARPGVGKSSFAANIAQNVAIRQNVPTVIFTLEMSKYELANRILCSEARIDNKKIKSADLTEEEMKKYMEAMEPVSEAPLFIDDTASISYTELRAKCKRLKMEHNIGLIVVDYLQLMSGPRKESRQQEISDISRNLKLIAKEIGVPLIALSQLSRAVEQRKDNHKPMLSDLRESGAIEQDADIVMFLYKEENYKEDVEVKNICQCIVAKNRAGETGDVKLYWQGEYTTFYTLEEDYK